MRDPKLNAAEFEDSLRDRLCLARNLFEKCELEEAEKILNGVLLESDRHGHFRGKLEALTGLLRLSGEALDEESIDRYDEELKRWVASNPTQVPPNVWYCRATLAWRRDRLSETQLYLHRCLKETRIAQQKNPDEKTLYGEAYDEELAKAWVALAIISRERGRLGRSRYLSETVLGFLESKKVKTGVALLCLNLAHLALLREDLDQARHWATRAQEAAVSSRNWYHYLHVLLLQAKLSRMCNDFAQAYWALNLLKQTAASPMLAAVRDAALKEESLLQDDAVDLMIDSPKGHIRTRSAGQVSLRKQFVLLNILEALSEAHRDSRGLSKAELIERVWKEHYRPASHDNKLYYNINRLRKILETDVSRPQILINWKEGYRLAPGLRVRWVQELREGELSEAQ